MLFYVSCQLETVVHYGKNQFLQLVDDNNECDVFWVQLLCFLHSLFMEIPISVDFKVINLLCILGFSMKAVAAGTLHSSQSPGHSCVYETSVEGSYNSTHVQAHWLSSFHALVIQLAWMHYSLLFILQIVCLFVCVVFNSTSAPKGYQCQESVKIKLVKKSRQ